MAVLRGPVVFGLNPSRDKQLEDVLLGTITLDTSSIEGPLADNTVRPDGMACKIRGWKPGAWYPRAKQSLELYLTELPDPAIQSIYFHVPNPLGVDLSDDELLGQPLFPSVLRTSCIFLIQRDCDPPVALIHQ